MLMQGYGWGAMTSDDVFISVFIIVLTLHSAS